MAVKQRTASLLQSHSNDIGHTYHLCSTALPHNETDFRSHIHFHPRSKTLFAALNIQHQVLVFRWFVLIDRVHLQPHAEKRRLRLTVTHILQIRHRHFAARRRIDGHINSTTMLDVTHRLWILFNNRAKRNFVRIRGVHHNQPEPLGGQQRFRLRFYQSAHVLHLLFYTMLRVVTQPDDQAY